MTKRSFIIIAALVLVFGIGSASAQNQVLRAEVPFEFTVGKKTLPAGEYTVTLPQTGGANVITIRNRNGRSLAIALTNWVNSEKAAAKHGLTFINSDGSYHLFQVHIPERELGQQLVKTGNLAGAQLARRTIELKPGRSE